MSKTESVLPENVKKNVSSESNRHVIVEIES